MLQEPVTVRLELESHPENVALVRSALSGIAEAVQLGDELTADLKTAVSEACNNISLHAYDESSGPMIIEIDGSGAGISASVIDHGRGLTRISGGEDRMGLGLAVISALADSSEFRHPEGGGTEVRMWFRRTGQTNALTSGLGADRRLGGRSLPHAPDGDTRGDDEILVYFTPVGVTRFVLGRIRQALAAAAHFSITKLTDLRVANEAIAGYIETAADGGVSITLHGSARRLQVRTGPLPSHDPDSARQALGAVVEYLTDEREQISFELLDHSRDPA